MHVGNRILLTERRCDSAQHPLDFKIAGARYGERCERRGRRGESVKLGLALGRGRGDGRGSPEQEHSRAGATPASPGRAAPGGSPRSAPVASSAGQSASRGWGRLSRGPQPTGVDPQQQAPHFHSRCPWGGDSPPALPALPERKAHHVHRRRGSQLASTDCEVAQSEAVASRPFVGVTDASREVADEPGRCPTG